LDLENEKKKKKKERHGSIKQHPHIKNNKNIPGKNYQKEHCVGLVVFF